MAVFTNRTGDSSLEPLGSIAADWVTRGLAQSAQTRASWRLGTAQAR